MFTIEREMSLNFQCSFKVKEKDIPYYHFYYENKFTEVLRKAEIQSRTRENRYYFKDGTYLPQFISQETTKQFDFSSDYVTFKRAMIVIIHRFSDHILRDLDNYYYKPFIDVIKKLKIIEDDSWEHVGILNIGGFAEEKENIEIFVIPFQYFVDFINQKLRFLFAGNYQFSSKKEQAEQEEMGNEFFDLSLLL